MLRRKIVNSFVRTQKFGQKQMKTYTLFFILNGMMNNIIWSHNTVLILYFYNLPKFYVN